MLEKSVNDQHFLESESWLLRSVQKRTQNWFQPNIGAKAGFEQKKDPGVKILNSIPDL